MGEKKERKEERKERKERKKKKEKRDIGTFSALFPAYVGEEKELAGLKRRKTIAI